MKKYKIGYTQGVYDMFHVGHLQLLINAKKQCEQLIVGVNSNRLVQEYKKKIPVINELDRKMIVENIKAVDRAEIVDSLDKVLQAKKYHFDAIFIGDDWRGDARWQKTIEDLKLLDVEVVFLPYTQGISSTILRPQNEDRVNEE